MNNDSSSPNERGARLEAHIPEAIWLLTVVLTPLLVNLWVAQQFEGSKIWLLRPLIWLLALWLGEEWLSGTRPIHPLRPFAWLTAVLAGLLILSTIFAVNPTIAFLGTLERAAGALTQLTYLLLFYLVARVIDATQGERLLRTMVWTSIPIVIFGFVQAAGGQPLPLFSDGRTLITTTLGRSNFTGAYLALLLPLTLTAARLGKTQLQRSGYMALLLGQILLIGLTQARAAWLAGAVGMVVLFWLWLAPDWSTTRRWFSVLLGGGLGVGVLALLLNRGIAAGGSLAARWTIWQASLKLLAARPWLGYGADSLGLVFPAVYPPQLVYYQGRGIAVDRAHNWLLDWSLNYGVLATVVLIALIALALAAGWRQLVTPVPVRPSGLAAAWTAAVMAAVVAHLVGNLFLFEVSATAVVFWLLIALLVAGTAPLHVDRPRPHDSLGRRVGFVIALFITIYGVRLTSFQPLVADFYYWRAVKAWNAGAVEQALVDAQEAVSWQPDRATYLAALGTFLARQGAADAAEGVLLRAAALRPTDPSYTLLLARLYGEQALELEDSGREIAAFETYARAIQQGPTIALIYQEQADLALSLGRLEAAGIRAGQAVDLDATDGRSYGILGWVALESGRPEEAAGHFRSAIQWLPQEIDFHVGLANAYLALGERAAAVRAVEAALQLDPADQQALALQEALNSDP